MVYSNPDNESATEHFDMVKGHWEDDVNRLKSLVDGVVDTNAFIKANSEYKNFKLFLNMEILNSLKIFFKERAIQKETILTEKAIEKSDPGNVVANTFCIGKRSKRVMEVENNMQN